MNSNYGSDVASGRKFRLEALSFSTKRGSSLLQESHSARVEVPVAKNRSIITTSPITTSNSNKTSNEASDARRDQIYAMNALLKQEENARFEEFKRNKGIFVSSANSAKSVLGGTSVRAWAA